MDIRRALGNMAFYRAPDGRTVFRPWGAWGKAYLVDEKAERRLTNFLGAWYGVSLVVIAWFAPRLGVAALVAMAAGMAGGVYIGYWVFSRTLPETEAPERPSPEYRKQLLKEHGQALGRPLLIVLIVLSTLMALAGVFVVVWGDWATGTFAVVFFGAATGLFVWQLRKL